MAFRQITPSDHAECMEQLAVFCRDEMGWQAAWNDDEGFMEFIIWPETPDTPETSGPGDRFRMWHEETMNNWTGGFGYSLVDHRGEYLFTGRMNQIGQFSRVWFYAQDSGPNTEAWCFMTVESTPGTFHNFYFGYLRKYGDWEGGALIDGEYWSTSSSYLDNNDYSKGRYRDYPGSAGVNTSDNHLLFSYDYSHQRPSYMVSDSCGGISIRVDLNSELTCGRFMDRYSNYTWTEKCRVGGGLTDEHNWELAGRIPLHTGQALLVPIQLFGELRPFEGNWWPLGEVVGIRMVNIDDIEPASLYFFAGKGYRVFPCSNKAYINRAIAVPEE